MSQDGVALIKQHLGIAELVGRYVTLKRKGSRLSACCPLHNEKTPSFYVDPEKGFFHCFGCGKGGDLIKFAQEIEGLDFVEALHFLADLAGVELPKRRRKGPGRDVLENLRALYEDAVAFYEGQLRRNKAAREYLKDRGLRDSTVKLFKLGCASAQWDGLYNHVRDRYEPKIIEHSGLFKQSERSGDWFDLFRDRIMFPIYDVYGRPVAFGGRLLGGDQGPKYINSPESPLFIKSKHVFNAQFAKAFFKKTKEAIIVEGYMDAIQIYQAGVGQVVAGLGTAFADEQAKLLNRFVTKVTLNFDGDRAGFKAARATVETFLRRGMDIRVIALPDGQDPDDFIKTHGVAAYRAQLDEARDFFTFLLDYLSDGQDVREDPRMRSFVSQEVCRSLSLIEDPVVRSHYLDRLAESLSLSRSLIDQVLAQQTAPAKARRREAQTPTPRPRRNPFNKIEQEFLFHALRRDNYTQHLREDHRTAMPRILSRVFHDRSWVMDMLDHPEVDLETRLAVAPEEEQGWIREILMSEAYDPDNPERLEELFFELYKEMLLKQVDIIKQRIRSLPPQEEERIKELLRKNAALKREYHNLLRMGRMG